MSGERLLLLARAWFADDMVTRVFEPLVADWAAEHETLRGLARTRSNVRVVICVAITAALMLPWQLKQRLPERVTLGGWIAIEAFVVIGGAAQWYLFFDGNPKGARYLLPALVATALPLALVPVAILMSRFATALELRTMMLRLALLSILALAPLLGWWLPASNQSWRVVQAGDTVRRGDRELSVNDLLRSQAPSDVYLGKARDWRTVRRNAALERASILVMPLTMMMLGLSIARRARTAWAVWAVAAWLAAALIWLSVLDISPWTAHAVILAAALAAGALPDLRAACRRLAVRVVV